MPLNDSAQKRCCACGRVLSADAFGRHKDAPDGLQWWCRACMRAYHQEHRDEHNARGRDRAHAQTARRRADRAANPPPPRTHKRCCRCHEVLPLEAFHRTKRTKDGHGTMCKQCAKAYRQEKAERLGAYGRAYRQQHAARIAASGATYRAAHHERLTQAKKDYYRAHALRSQAKVRAWQQANPERYKAIVARSRIRHPEFAKARKANRSARMQLAGGSIGARDVRAMRAAQRGCCAYCGQALGPRYHLDHMMPISRGGCNHPANGCLACARCNLKKATRSAGEFLALLLRERHAQTTV